MHLLRIGDALVGTAVCVLDRNRRVMPDDLALNALHRTRIEVLTLLDVADRCAALRRARRASSSAVVSGSPNRRTSARARRHGDFDWAKLAQSPPAGPKVSKTVRFRQ
ncbi:hypothetical protein [Streptomyces zagrosensis]|uniref:Uncharacterized protein n=1 Tax=Streptomyces zagrosensis TaxID=1042984 RepID=A0A7W9QFC6_9ACTN|nr:hypothetical protein [Streptomyces zagrosensis]MBB5939251.1 hypothetical protein [Streptomyces zagrosensis]